MNYVAQQRFVETMGPNILTCFFFCIFLGIYRPRALPSAGLFPFARSFLCDFKSTKTNDPSEILNGLPDLRSSRYIVHTTRLRTLFQYCTKQSYLSTFLHAKTYSVLSGNISFLISTDVCSTY